ncbi:alpha-L-fucosidase [Bacillus sp. AGMB 02131]|uniref:Alpha-L-fucosidase n=1 Tax=Peribacillus faecalis TaxID=2772559 RepID=A0A927CTU4_9BACI|nr:AIR synthase related protein [Peribacillus faecalis]MBD3107733.1 alpha-L-fucosidase [Peribacillus faecalis]
MQIRDLTIVPLPNEQYIVTAVDISASIGEKPNDILQVTPELTGKMAARVPLMEVLASGAQIIAINDVVGAEIEPTGKRVIKGIEEEMQLAGLAHLELNGSTEENMTTSQTSVGVTVIGLANFSYLKVNNVKRDAILFGYGEPRMGEELVEKPELEVTYELIKSLVERDDVFEIVPIGSKGILYEANLLARLNDCLFQETASCTESLLRKSAGPVTAVIIAVDENQAATFVQTYPEAYVIGKLKKNQ